MKVRTESELLALIDQCPDSWDFSKSDLENHQAVIHWLIVRKGWGVGEATTFMQQYDSSVTEQDVLDSMERFDYGL